MLKVLLVDDDINDLYGIQNNVSWVEYGMEVCGTAYDGAQGLEMAKRLSPDVIISDIAMPQMNGLEFIKEYQKTDPTVVPVLMTCFEESFTALRCRENLRFRRVVEQPYGAFVMPLDRTMSLS